MNENTKVILSSGELAIALDKEFILTKRKVMDKAGALFNSNINTITKVFSPAINQLHFPEPIQPKIAKGENYLGLPFVLLDYPSSFSKTNVFALRTMFWWGNFISITLHLSGEYKLLFEKNIFEKLKDEDLCVCVGQDEWQHHFEVDNYKIFSTLSETEIEDLQQKSFLKIALKYELHHWNMMQHLLPQGYSKMYDLLKT
jgi:hypothetical protein